MPCRFSVQTNDPTMVLAVAIYTAGKSLDAHTWRSCNNLIQIHIVCTEQILGEDQTVKHGLQCWHMWLPTACLVKPCWSACLHGTNYCRKAIGLSAHLRLRAWKCQLYPMAYGVAMSLLPEAWTGKKVHPPPKISVQVGHTRRHHRAGEAM